MAKSVLIVYSSGYGTTKEIAHVIGNTIQDSDLNVQIASIDQVDSLGFYDTVIIGTSVRADRILANTRDFIHTKNKELSEKKVALFVVCLTANSAEGERIVLNEYLPQFLEKYPQIHFFKIAAFGGSVNLDQFNPVMKSIVKNVMDKKGFSEGNSIKDWSVIEKWAKELKMSLVSD